MIMHPKPHLLYQRHDDSILFSIETLQKLQDELPSVPRRVSPLSTTFVPVLIPGPASAIEKWLWRSTAAAASMLFLFFVATVAVLLSVRLH
jgi:hypothetical protein